MLLAASLAVFWHAASSESDDHRADPADTTSPARVTTPDVEKRLRALERRADARIGLFAVDTGSGESVAYRADERFALASTVKVPLAAVVLEQLSASGLDERVFWEPGDLLEHAPVTRASIDSGMTVRELIHASLTQSDNTAANLLFETVGGPAAVDRRLAELGDSVTSIDRVEPGLNDWRPGEVRDTSTPAALARTFRRLALGDVLEPADRRVLNDDLSDSLTGAGLVRAGVPSGWPVGDKSGTASYGTRNDVAVVRPPGRAPWVVVVMTSHPDPDAEPDDGLVARATAVVTQALDG